MDKPIAVRFAPSPTGPLHVGGVRTALYDHLFAKKLGGRCILRIEDTDQTRYVPGTEEYIKDALTWLGLSFNEGPGMGGEAGPYRQSERKEIYKQYIDQLVESNHAYIAFDTPGELDAMREKLKAEGKHNLQYNHEVRDTMSNSLSLEASEVQKRIEGGEPYVVRMKMPKNEAISFKDIVREEVTFNSGQLDDKVLMKSDGMPTYHLANVVDDKLMGITHVVRGEEWLSSTPLHIMLYRAFGWEEHIPQFIHVPLILNPNGKGKMSKRQGDKLGFSVFPTNWTDPETGKISIGFKERGYLPETMLNFLALLGWNPGNDEELMNEDRIVELFSFEQINNSASKFDLDKLNWFNEQYIRSLPESYVAEMTKPFFEEAGITIPDEEVLTRAIGLLKERVTLLPDFVSQGKYLFGAPTEYDAKTQRKRWNEEARSLIGDLQGIFANISDWRSQVLHDAFKELIEEKGVGMGKVMAPLRLVLTGLPSGPGIFDIAEILGKDECLQRMSFAIENLAVS